MDVNVMNDNEYINEFQGKLYNIINKNVNFVN